MISITFDPGSVGQGEGPATNDEASRMHGIEETVCAAIARFAAAHWDEIDGQIELALADLLELTRTDNCGLFTIDAVDAAARLTHVARPRDESSIGRPELVKLAGAAYERVVEGGETWTFGTGRDLPPISRDVPPIEASVGCGLYLPAVMNGGVRCVLAFVSAESKREWPPHLVRRLTMVAGVFADALRRKHAAERVLPELRAAECGELRERYSPRAQSCDPARIAQTGLLVALAHELSQPVSAILHNAQAALRLLESGNLGTAEMADILRDIVADDKRAGGVIETLRAVLRRQTVERHLVDVGDVVFDVLQLMRSELVAAQVETVTEVEARCCTMADRAQIQQVLLNLAINALDAMQAVNASCRRLRIVVSKSSNGAVRVSISDSGKGLSADMLDTVFDALSANAAPGKGMGLAVARSIVEAHGGRIWAERRENEGATFLFTLPGVTPQK